MTSFYTRRVAGLLAGCTLMVSALFAEGPKLVLQSIADDFGTGESRRAGQPLPPSAAGLYGPVWNVEGSVLLTEDSAVSTRYGGAAWIPLEENIDAVQLKATLRPEGTDWVALAIGGKWATSFYKSAQLWMLLRPNGEYQLRINGNGTILAQGAVPDFTIEKANAVELRYLKDPRTVTLIINGHTVADGLALPSDFTPALDSAGFKFNGPIAAPLVASVDDFSVTFKAPLTPRCAMSLSNASAIYAPDDAMSAIISGRGLSAASVNIKSFIETFEGERLQERETSHAVKQGAFAFVLSLSETTRVGYFVLTAEVTTPDGESLGRFIRPFVIIPEPLPITLSESNVFGGMVYPFLHYPFADREKDARLMQRIGLNWVRTARINWINAQSAADAPIRWTEIDRDIEMYQSLGIRIIATSGWPTPIWGSQARDLKLPEMKGNFMPTPEALVEGRRFYRELATRHRGRIAAYEIGNEVDAHFWHGGVENFRTHNIEGIIKDYFDYFTALSGEILAVDPDALVGPSVTSRTEGVSYRPWLTTVLKLGMGDRMTAFFPHYHFDVDYLNNKLREYGVAEKPVIFTETGGFSRSPRAAEPRHPEMRLNIRNDYLQMATHLTHGNVRALCKFIFREQPTYGGEGTIVAGLLGTDFTPRASYPAFATLVRYLAGAKFVEYPNIARSSSSGWVRAFTFERDGERIHFLFLNGAGDAQVTLTSAADALTHVDVMGNLTKLPLKNGKTVITMTPDLPVIILGPIIGAPGPLDIPQDTMVSETVIKLGNPGFEASVDRGDTIPGWRINGESAKNRPANKADRFQVSVDDEVKHSGARSVRMDATQPTLWYGISQKLPMDQMPRPGPGEYLKVKFSCYAKGRELHGKGLGYTLVYRGAGGAQLQFAGSPYFGFGGTYDWKQLVHEHRIDSFPEGTQRIDVDIQLGKTAGTVWVDDVEYVVQLWRKP